MFDCSTGIDADSGWAFQPIVPPALVLSHEQDLSIFFYSGQPSESPTRHQSNSGIHASVLNLILLMFHLSLCHYPYCSEGNLPDDGSGWYGKSNKPIDLDREKNGPYK
jgi:hypothetical protein